MAQITRRTLLIGGGAAAGLLVAWSVWPRSADSPAALDGEGARFNAFVRIDPNGAVTVSVPQCEMGQGVTTLLPQIVAEELGADWRTVAVAPAPPQPIFANVALARQWRAVLAPGDGGTGLAQTFWSDESLAREHMQAMTAGDTSLANFALPCREAGAAARVLLCKAAARRWDVSWEACQAENGFVTHQDQRVRFAELLADAVEEDLPDPLPLRLVTPEPPPPPGVDPAELPNPFPRLDLPAKVDGSVTFAADIRLPDMVFAAVRAGPIGDSSLKEYDREAAEAVSGFVDLIEDDRWLAALAGNWWAANRALAAASPVFETRGTLPSDEGIGQALQAALDEGPGWRMFKRGDVEAALDLGERRGFDYSIAAAAHAAIETPSATARFIDGELELWTASQAPAVVVAACADALGISESAVTLYPLMAGGSFDRRLERDVAVQAAVLAQRARRPVQLMWSRGEEMLHDPVRTPVRARLTCTTRADGAIDALKIGLALPATAREFAQRVIFGDAPFEAVRATRGEADALAVAGAVPPYDIASWAVDHFPADIGVPTGRWRGNAHSYGVFVLESAIDELAALAEREPLSYRMQMLGNAPRLATCLSAVAEMAQWDGGADNSGQGLACCAREETYIAVIAEARRGASDGGTGIRVDRLYAAVSAGRLVNRDIARQQIEGGLLFGLAMAMGGAISYRDGLAQERTLGQLALPRLADAPRIDIRFLESDAPSGDLGELGVPAVAPALANAIFSATGLRLRNLPLIQAGL